MATRHRGQAIVIRRKALADCMVLGVVTGGMTMPFIEAVACLSLGCS
ncbi:hypothetical protein [Amycolatopsis sp. RTGN1]|nr:hypothetical protein [Amycolatopsis sp. RTGN1]